MGKHYAVKTKTGVWHLVEKDTSGVGSMLGASQWYVLNGEKKEKIGFLMSQDEDVSSVLEAFQVNNEEKVKKPLLEHIKEIVTKGKIILSNDITIEKFKNRKIVLTRVWIKKPEDLAIYRMEKVGHSQTIVEHIEIGKV